MLLLEQLKKLGALPMGNLQLAQLQSATGDDGRARLRTVDDPKQQVSNAFDQNQHQLLITGYNESNQYPTGSAQSKIAVSFEEVKKHSPVPVRIHPDADAIAGGGFYLPSEDYIGIAEGISPDLLAHEIGHAQFQKTPLGKTVQSIPLRTLHTISPIAGLAAGATMQHQSTPKRFLKSLLLGLGLGAPTLIGEGAATYKGYKLLENAGADDKRLSQYWRNVLPSQASYLINPLITGAAGTAWSKTSAAHKLDRRMKFRDFNISIETDKGNYRHWYDSNSKSEGKTLMRYPYGYIRGTQGMDGDHVDCFVGPNETAKNVYVITTNKAPNFERIDEQKCMLGFNSSIEAKQVFLQHYTNPKFFNNIREFPYEEFKEKVWNTLRAESKKIASTISFDAMRVHGTGPFHDQVPGDYLGLPSGSLVGMRKVEGDPMSPSDKIDRQFRFHDMEMNTRTLDGNDAALPSSPGV